MDALGVFLFECDAMPTSSHIRSVYASLHYGFFNQRTRWIWVGLTGMISLLLCFVPLFNLLAFEFCFAISVPLSLGAGYLGARHPPAPFEAGDRRDDYLTIILALSAAISLICLNALRVENCNFTMGLGSSFSSPVEYFRRVVLGAQRSVRWRDPQTIFVFGLV